MVAQVSPPSKPYPNTFDMSRDEFEDSINRFVGELGPICEGLNDVAVEVNEAVATVDAAVASLASSKWISGTTYAIGDVRYSTADYFNYRRKTAGAGTTDPSLDPTNWALLTKTANGGSDTFSSAVDHALSATAARLQIISMTAANKKVTLPASTALVKGSSIFVIRNAGGYRFAIRNNAGAFLCWLNPGQVVSLGCSDISTAAGVWTLNGEKLDRIYDGEAATVVNSVASSMISVAALSATKAVVVYQNGSDTFPYAVIVNSDGTIGTPVKLADTVPYSLVVTMLSSTVAVVAYQSSNRYVYGHVLTINTNAITVGAVQSIHTATTGIYSSLSLATLSATKILVGYHFTTGTYRERIASVSGNNITPVSAEVIAESSSSATTNVAYDLVKTISASKALAVIGGGSVWRFQDTSGATPAPIGSVLGVTTYGAGAGVAFAICILSTTRALLIRYKQVSLIDISDTTPVHIVTKFMSIDLISDGAHVLATKLDANRALAVWTNGYSGGIDARVITATADDRLVFSDIQEKLEPGIGANLAYVALDTLDSTHVIAAHRNASGFLSSKIIEIN